jgi:outer membrane beta-barrel protein
MLRSPRLIPSLLAAVLVSVAAPAMAAADAKKDDKAGDKADAPKESEDKNEFQRVEERSPRAGTPLIASKLYPMQYKFEISGLFDYSFNDKYVEHLGGQGALAFHLFDWLALEGFGGYLVGDETGIVQNVRTEGSSQKRAPDTCATPLCEPQLPDMWMTTWFAGADVQWSPIYGKISAVSEYDLNFMLYGLAGAGAEGITRKLNDGSFDTPQVRFSGNYGIGVRLMPWKFLALRAEVRNYNGLNPNVQEHESRDENDCKEGYTLVVGTERQCFPDISNNTMLQVGLSLIL